MGLEAPLVTIFLECSVSSGNFMCSAVPRGSPSPTFLSKESRGGSFVVRCNVSSFSEIK